MLINDRLAVTTIALRSDGADADLVANTLPYAKEFIMNAGSLSKFGSKRDIRPYLRDLLRCGAFEIISPRTGKVLSSGTSIILNDKSVFFGFPDEPDLLVGVDNLSTGFPISAAFIRSLGLLISTGNIVWGINASSVVRLTQIIDQMGWKPKQSYEPITLVSGDANFAHHAWNQLPCLSAVIESESEFSVLSTHEPLGELSELFPEKKGRWVQRCPASYLEKANQPNRTFAPVGSTLVTRKTVNRILDYAVRNLTAEAQNIAAKLASAPGKIFWMSVRMRNRTVLNQAETLEAVGIELLRTFPNSTIVLDGHSQQCDLMQNRGSYDIPQTDAIILEDERVARDIAAALSPHGKVVLAIGLPVTDTVYLAQFVNFYVCHHGTIQHKIGWFTAIPGVVHSNSRTLSLRPAKWVAEQSEIALEPCYLPECFIDDDIRTTDQDEQAASLRLENYSIVEKEKVADFIALCARIELNESD
jgi:hypothetical protein